MSLLKRFVLQPSIIEILFVLAKRKQIIGSAGTVGLLLRKSRSIRFEIEICSYGDDRAE